MLFHPSYDILVRKQLKESGCLCDLKESVEKDEQTIDAMDTKSSFISGFIVRQLVKEGVIDDTG